MEEAILLMCLKKIILFLTVEPNKNPAKSELRGFAGLILVYKSA